MIDREVRAVLLAVAMLLLPGRSLFAIDEILTGEHLQLTFEGWDASHGLPQSSVQTVVQTDDGYLWIGTMGGLARFDGARFRVFDRKTTPELGDSLVQALLADGDRLWIGTGSGGALVYDGETFRRIEGLPSDMVWDFTRGGDGRIWVATQAGLAVIGQAGAKRVSIPGIPMDAPFFALATDRHGAVWGGTEQGVLFQIDTHEVTTWGRDDGLPVAAIRAIKEGGAGAMWIGTESGLIRYNGVSFERFTTRDGLASNVVRAIIPDYEGDLWVGTYGGLSRRHAGQFDSYDRSELASETIRSLLADREGNLWIGTGGGGLLRARPALVRSLPSSEVVGFARSVLETRSASVWVGTFGDGALEIRDGKTRRLTVADGLPDDVVYSLAEDDEGRIWFGTRNGVARWNGSRFDQVLADPETFASRVVRALFIDADGALWIGTLRGIYRWDESGIRKFGRDEGMAGDAVFNFAQSRDGTLWAASYGGGLHRLEGARFVPVPSGPDVPTSRVWSITIADDGTLWMGSRGAGLVRYREGEFFAFDTRAGLFDDVVYQVIEDGQGRLWMSGNKGIFAVLKSELEEFSAGDRSQITTLTLGKAEGMRSPECNGATQPAGWRTHDGLILFPTLDGIAVVDPDSARRSVSDPKVIVEAMVVNGKAIAMDESVSISPGADRIEITYSGLMFSAPERLSFRYRLEPLDSDWIDAGPERSARYTNLTPGDYRFAVVAADRGTGSADQAELRFTIEPQPWQTVWFWLAATLIGASFVALVLWWVKVFARRRELELVDLVERRTRELATANELLAEQSRIDSLTQVANRRHFDEVLDAEWRRAIRERSWLALLLVDVDHFKAFNDAYGHQLGDECLRTIAEALRETGHRPGDLVARYGGEEFGVILAGAEPEAIARLAENLRSRVESQGCEHDHSPVAPVVTVSVGAAAVRPHPGLRPHQLIALADKLLYRAKREGRNCVRLDVLDSGNVERMPPIG